MEQHNLLFSSVAEDWLITVKNSVKANTYRYTYINNVKNHLIPEFGDRRIDELQYNELQQFVNSKALEYKRDTIIKMIRVLKKIFEYAYDIELCIKNPAVYLKAPKSQDEEEEMQIYTDDQVQMIYNFAEAHRFGLEIAILLDTGMRRSEMLALKWSDFDEVKGILKVRRSVADIKPDDDTPMTVFVGKTKNRTSRRDIPLSKTMCEKLKARQQTSEYIFPNKFGKVQSPATWSRKHYDRFMKEMHDHYNGQGIDMPVLSPHKLRHTRASIWVNSGLNLYAIAKVLGHTNLEMLEKRYAHSNVEQLRFLLDIE